MSPRIFPICSFLAAIIAISLLHGVQADARVISLSLIDAYATLPGETARVGLFEKNQQIDLLFQFDLDTDTNETAYLTWDVSNRYGRASYSSSQEMPCESGPNSVRVPDAIPLDLGTGVQTYDVYASVRVGEFKEDTEFEIRIESPQAIPGVRIEDVRLIPREDDSIVGQELGSAAIPYTIEIDFRIENIVSWAHARIRWLGQTVDGFILDEGLGTTDVETGFNTFDADSYLARPPRGSTPEADLSVEVIVVGYFDTVTFPFDTLPVSLTEIRSSRGVENEYAFSVGEAYMATVDGARAGHFGRNEPITARLLTGGIVPENARLLMRMNGATEEIETISEDFMLNLEAGTECPVVDFGLPMGIEREPGFYDFTWSVFVGNVLYAERYSHLTISNRTGFEVPVVIDLPGDAEFSAPLPWDVTQESEPGLYATMVTPDGIICRLLGQQLEEPLNVELLADIFESDSANSGIPDDATELTTEKSELEGVWESIRRGYIGDGKVFVHEYWLYRSGSGEYQFLIATSVGDEDQVTEAYSASDMISSGLNLGV